MPRPPKCRRIESLPGVTYFKPAGIPMRVLAEAQISLDELEAIRLKDLEGLEQEDGAVKMDVSRPTFQRILSSARQKLADAVVNGKALRIEGGNFEVAQRRFRCAQGHESDTTSEVSPGGQPVLCPACGSPSVGPVSSKSMGWRSRGRAMGRRSRLARGRIMQQPHEEVQQ